MFLGKVGVQSTCPYFRPLLRTQLAHAQFLILWSESKSRNIGEKKSPSKILAAGACPQTPSI